MQAQPQMQPQAAAAMNPFGMPAAAAPAAPAAADPFAGFGAAAAAPAAPVQQKAAEPSPFAGLTAFSQQHNQQQQQQKQQQQSLDFLF